MPLLHSILHATNFSRPFLSTLVPSIGLAFALQGAVAIPSIIAQSERFYDLSGSLTYLSCTALSLYLPTLRARAAAAASGSTKPAWPSILGALSGRAGGWNWRQVVLSAAVAIWATRLGTYLFSRISASAGTDSRFSTIRSQPRKFLLAFLAQAAWVSTCCLPVLALNSLPSTTAFASLPSLIALTDVLGLCLYAGGLGLEAAADAQKSAWLREKREKRHSEEFLTRGLWGRSRHPNYAGEVALWTGIATVAGGVLVSRAGLAGMGFAAGGVGGVVGRMLGAGMAASSPAFVLFVLLKVSGVPMSEEKYDKRFGDREEYWEWKRNTPMLVPRIW